MSNERADRPRWITCPECDGTGWIAPDPALEPHPGYDCSKCEGRLEVDARLEVKVEK